MALSVRRIVNATISASPMAAQKRGFGILMVLGDSPVMTAVEGYRSYNDYESVAGDFGADAPETLAAQAYFSQSPKPLDLKVSRWFNAPTAAQLQGGAYSTTFSELQHEKCGFKITIDAHEIDIVDMDTTECLEIGDIAALITTKLTTYGRCTVSGDHLLITSNTTGSTSNISLASAPTGAGSGVTDVSALLGLTTASGAQVINGKDESDSLSNCLSRLLLDYGRDFYGLLTATTKELEDDDIFTIAQAIQGSAESHIYGFTTTDSTLASTAYTPESNDIASKLMRGQYDRTICFYADYDADDAAYRLNPYFAASALGRMFSVNFNGMNTTITLKFKQAPSIQPSNLTPTQVTNLQDRNINVYATYDNDTYIIEKGVMCNGTHADERHGLDWLNNAIETAVYNKLYQSKTKIPQTDDGHNMIKSAIEGALEQGVENGLLAPGKWNSEGFGDLQDGDYLESGYYVWFDSVDNQDQADREARKSQPFQWAGKLAGAIESVDIIGTVNR